MNQFELSIILYLRCTRYAFVILVLCLTSSIYGQLKVSDNKRFLVNKDGTPFFWMGDTAWELFHRLTLEEAAYYFKTRASQGFNVVQAVILAEFDGLKEPNAYGEIPLEQNDPMRPKEAYFKYVDEIIDLAASYNIYIGLLPTWGDKVFKDRWGAGPEIFNAANAFGYGKWLGQRYASRKNIVWILGGDRNPRHNADVEVWRSMARGIVDGVGGLDKTLMTFHPQPNSLEDGGSSKWFHGDSWLDFNMFQTGHCRENNVWARIQVAYNRNPVKPVLDGEPLYEDHPVCFNAKDLGTSSAFDVRKHAYLDVFAGAFGHTYGCHSVWQMNDPKRPAINGPHFVWKEALELPGAMQMRYLKHLVESRPMLDRIPDQTMVINPLQEHNRIQATRGKDYIMVYSSEGFPIDIVLGMISGSLLNGYWYDPHNGKTKSIGDIKNIGRQQFNPPTKGYGQDWVLVLDDVSKNYPDPVYVQK